MHESIEELMVMLKKNNVTSLALKEIVDYLHKQGCSGSETFVVLTNGLGFCENEADLVISNSNYWSNEDPLEIMKEIAILTNVGREIDDSTISLNLK